jgi:hypothetical protein
MDQADALGRLTTKRMGRGCPLPFEYDFRLHPSNQRKAAKGAHPGDYGRATARCRPVPGRGCGENAGE